MARPLRLEFPGALYHLTARGNARQEIFLDDEDRSEFLAVLANVVERFGWRCHAYCLMGNHYHLLVETPQPNLSRGMRQLNGVFTMRFNRRHQRVGHLLQGRFKSILVDKDSYLLELCRYVVLNPVRAGVVSRLDRYLWSSYRATAGLTSPPRFLTTHWLLAQFARQRAHAQQRYRAFVAEGLNSDSPWGALQGQVLLGDGAFVDTLSPMLASREDQGEIPRQQRKVHRPSLAKLLPRAATQDKRQRDRAIHECHVTHGYRLAEIGRHLGLHYATISRIVAQQDRS